MKIEVEAISKAIITPSSPTPHHLRHHQLSFLDQLAPNAFIPFIYFYSFNPSHNHTQISAHLKKSLSQILTQYHPLAGRVKLNLFVDCNDLGVPFYEARVKDHTLSDVITNPHIAELNKLLPFKLDEATDVVFGVQLNLFRCGGVAIGLCVSHRVGDGLSYYTFVNNWASAACGNASFALPDFSAAKIFPPRKMEGYNGVTIPRNNDIVTKKFVFDGSKVEALRAEYAEYMSLKTKKLPSRVEALSAFLWNMFMVSQRRREVSSTKTLYTAVYIMDLRSRFNPPLPQSCFGNYYRAATAVPVLANEECGGLVRQVIEEIENIDNSYMWKFQGGYREHLDFMRKRMERAGKGELVTVTFSSVCRFPMYEADFGWGKPEWVSMASMRINNQIVFMDTKMRDGIESYFSFKEEDMAKFEHDSQFLALVSPPVGNVNKNSFARL